MFVVLMQIVIMINPITSGLYPAKRQNGLFITNVGESETYTYLCELIQLK